MNSPVADSAALNQSLSIDPYTVRIGAHQQAPTTFMGRLKHLGPSVVISGSIVGSGEIILTSSLGAAAGFVLLWWVLMSCWIKSLIQAELSRYTIISGDTYLRAFNRLPGKIWGPKGKVGWPIWLGLIAFIPGVMGQGGIIGGAGQAFSLLFPSVDSAWASLGVTIAAIMVLNFASYKHFEKVLLALVFIFTMTTLVCAILMQFTQYQVSWADVRSGFTFELPIEYIAIALAVYGYTGVNSGETSAYTYWCIEKGYPSNIGKSGGEPGEEDAWLNRANGWIKVLQMDVWATLLILTCATLPFYFLGAGVLNAIGETPDGLRTLTILSDMFTKTLGEWALWVFGTGAFCILFSTTLSAFGGGARFIPDYLIELGFMSRDNIRLRKAIIKGYTFVMPIAGYIIYLFIQNPVLLVTIAASVGAVMLPIQSGGTLWLQKNNMDQRIAPKPYVRKLIWLIFLFQLVMAYFVIRYVVF